MSDHHVVIIGGGFAGLYAAQRLARRPVRVTLIDRRNFHLFQPLLYQVATGGLSPANIAAPLRAVLSRQKNVEVLLGEATGIDAASRKVFLKDGPPVSYDSLIVATGARHSYFGKPEWEKLAPGLKTIEDATEIRRRVLLAFESAERLRLTIETTEKNQKEPSATSASSAVKNQISALLTFVIIGGGPTGVELAGALGEIARHTLKNNFRHINPADAKIILLEGMDRILGPYPPELSARAVEDLKQLGVSVRTGAVVTDISESAVKFKSGDTVEEIQAKTVLWAAGVAASPLGKTIAHAAGAETDKAGRVIVEPNLSLKGHPEILVIGDLANFKHGLDKPLPGVAPVAMQQGSYVAGLIYARLSGKTIAPFKYHNRGSMATIGRNRAVVDLGCCRFTGWIAWVTWLFVHLMYLVQFQNRVLVLWQWAWNYFTRNRAARLITDTAESVAKGEPAVALAETKLAGNSKQ